MHPEAPKVQVSPFELNEKPITVEDWFELLLVSCNPACASNPTPTLPKLIVEGLTVICAGAVGAPTASRAMARSILAESNLLNILASTSGHQVIGSSVICDCAIE
jgi:hypothetical protein